MAGIIFLITPKVKLYVTPSIPKFSARFKAVWYIQLTSSILSASTPLVKCFFHSIIKAYSIQCSGIRGVSAIVHKANVFLLLLIKLSVHEKHAVL